MSSIKSDNEKAQRQRFIDKSRELGCDEDEAAFDEKLRRIGKAKPPKDSDPNARKPQKG